MPDEQYALYHMNPGGRHSVGAALSVVPPRRCLGHDHAPANADRIASTFAGQEPEATFKGDGGCYLEVGSISPGNVFSYDATALVRASARLVAVSNYSPWALARALAFLRRNHARFPFDRLISHVYPLARIGAAFREADWMQKGGDGLRLSRAALSMTD